MSYRTVADIQQDGFLMRRVVSCAALEGIPSPQQWVADNALDLAKQPGWDTKWEQAIANGVTAPGNQENVIDDGMILSAVQALHNAEATEGEQS